MNYNILHGQEVGIGVGKLAEGSEVGQKSVRGISVGWLVEPEQKINVFFFNPFIVPDNVIDIQTRHSLFVSRKLVQSGR